MTFGEVTERLRARITGRLLLFLIVFRGLLDRTPFFLLKNILLFSLVLQTPQPSFPALPLDSFPRPPVCDYRDISKMYPDVLPNTAKNKACVRSVLHLVSPKHKAHSA